MEFSFNRGSAQKQDTPEISNDRLRKAIERNKSKMNKRQALPKQAVRGSLSANARQAPISRRPSLAEKLRGTKPQGMPANTMASKLRSSDFAPSIPPTNTTGSNESLLEKMRARREGKAMPQREPARSAGSVLRRKSVTSAENIEIQAPERRPVGAASRAVGYSKATPVAKNALSAKRKVRTKNHGTQGLSNWFVKGTWIFCAFLLVRLVFSDGGVTEYYSKKSNLENKIRELESLKLENKNLMNELESIKLSSKFQKKLVRDHLGYIAKDEYLILFSKNSENSSFREVSSI